MLSVAGRDLEGKEGDCLGGMTQAVPGMAEPLNCVAPLPSPISRHESSLAVPLRGWKSSRSRVCMVDLKVPAKPVNAPCVNMSTQDGILFSSGFF